MEREREDFEFVLVRDEWTSIQFFKGPKCMLMIHDIFQFTSDNIEIKVTSWLVKR